ncbi:hypothetical protein MPSEU_000254800 [Mayamaea pseudoterrestris]|nr:hypothetical protein MPSEU_000254800 [Mayamaea pseudoterrestris]
MGTGSSTLMSGGTLRGSYAPPIRDDYQAPTLAKPKKLRVPLAKGKKSGDIVTVSIDGRKFNVTIPPNVTGPSFNYDYEGDVAKVIASTLPTIPGMDVIQAKPIIWGSVSHAYLTYKKAKDGQQLMQDAQTELLKQALEVGCNAVLGVNYSFTIDSSGDSGQNKMVVATCYGTPCIVTKLADLSVIHAEAVPVSFLNNF